MRKLTALFLAVLLTLTCAPVLGFAGDTSELSYRDQVAARLGPENEDRVFRLTASHTFDGSKHLTVSVVLDDIHTEDRLAMFLINFHYNQDTMENVTPQQSDGAFDCVSGLPSNKWENLCAMSQDGTTIMLAIGNPNAESDTCKTGDRIEFTLHFELKDGCTYGEYWIPHKESEATDWDLEDYCGNGGFGVFHTLEAPAELHSFTEMSTDMDHFCEAATCQHPERYFYSCPECGQNGEETFEVGGLADHTGGTADCQHRAVCDVCHQEYGELDPDNHTGGTELRGVLEPTFIMAGYTGDLYCLGCGGLIEKGKPIAPSLGEPAEDPSFRTTMSQTVNGDHATVHVVIDNIRAEDKLASFLLYFYYDMDAMENLTPKQGDGAYACVTGMPSSKWENFCAMSIDGSALLLSIGNSESEADCCNGTERIEFTLEFALKEGFYEGLYWIPHAEATADDWDFHTYYGNGGSGTFHGVSAPEEYHSYTAMVIGDEHLAKGADCTHAATYYYSCPGCGKNGEKTFEDGEPLGHIGGTADCCHAAVCDRCHEEYGETDPNYHIGATERVGRVRPTFTSIGYTGDICCAGCHQVLEAGMDTPKLGD
ncbi:MAG: hypothetical protein ILO68_07635, partial [Clostridia bacterium]|nr:hypothetical protein [Clostridia bacterium]